MPRIGLLSDTHSHLDEAIFRHFETCDEIWHAGDIGDLDVARRLAEFRPLQVVFGNIDGAEARAEFPETLRFERGGVEVLMTHIGGYPGRYSSHARALLREKAPGLFICGHSHILKVMRDPQNDLIHLNPGACGVVGFHQVKTVLRFDLEDGKVDGLEVIEWER